MSHLISEIFRQSHVRIHILRDVGALDFGQNVFVNEVATANVGHIPQPPEITRESQRCEMETVFEIYFYHSVKFFWC